MKRVLAVLLLYVSHAVWLGAQTFRGAVNGTVTDPSGAVVLSAQVGATEIATGVIHNTVTTAAGQFSIQDLPLGAYTITVVVPRFAKYTADNVRITAGSVYTLTIKLPSRRKQAPSMCQPLRSSSIPRPRLKATRSRTMLCRICR
jgi:hypothetical protein